MPTTRWAPAPAAGWTTTSSLSAAASTANSRRSRLTSRSHTRLACELKKPTREPRVATGGRGDDGCCNQTAGEFHLDARGVDARGIAGGGRRPPQAPQPLPHLAGTLLR